MNTDQSMWMNDIPTGINAFELYEFNDPRNCGSVCAVQLSCWLKQQPLTNWWLQCMRLLVVTLKLQEPFIVSKYLPKPRGRAPPKWENVFHAPFFVQVSAIYRNTKHFGVCRNWCGNKFGSAGKKSRRKFKSHQKNEINFPVLCRCIQLQSIVAGVECGDDSAKPDLETAIGKTSLMYISDDGNIGDNDSGYHCAIRLKRNLK